MFLSNKKNDYYNIIFLIIFFIAIVIRVPALTRRPMHTDEAVHAVKFGKLLEDNYYRFDSREYHGPTLNYLTLIPAWIKSADNITEINETTLRIIPVFFGIMMVLMLWFLAPGLNRFTITAAGIFTAVSPSMVFYSRYYIQEILLVFFSFAVIISCYRYIKGRNFGWALTAGIFLGLLHATKETCVIALGSMLIAVFLVLLISSKNKQTSEKVNLWHMAMIIAAMFSVSALFYSSFFSNLSGIPDSYLTFKNYLSKAGTHDWHIHPWYYYIKMLLFTKDASGPLWSEAFILLLAAAGFWVSIKNKRLKCVDIHLLRFISFYTVIMLIIYSAIPYKTPWNLLSFHLGLILLAAVGAAAIFNVLKNSIRIIFLILFAAGSIHLLIQSYSANFKYYADPSNPYVYGHTSNDIFRIVRRAEDIAEVHTNRNNMYIEVVCPGHDYWPLPWYLRDFPNIGWWDKVDKSTPAAPVIIAFPGVEQEIIKKLYDVPPPGEKNLYVPLFDSYTELRPMVEIRGYVIKELYDKYVQSKE